MPQLRLPIIMLLVMTLTSASALAAPPTGQHAASAQAIFKKYCISCHDGDDADGELLLTSHTSALKGGKRGPAIVAGKPEASLLVKLMERRAKPFMPPDNNKGPRRSEIDVIKAWIASGAKPFPAVDPVPSLTVPRVPTRGVVRQPVNAVVISRTADWFAVARTGRVDLYAYPPQPGDVSKSRPIAALTGLPGQVSDLAISADGKHLVASAGEPGLYGEARIYSIERDASGKNEAADRGPALRLVRTIRGHSDSLNAVALSADGHRLATGSYDRTIVIWDVATGKQLMALKGHNGPVTGVAFDPRGRFLASSSGDRTVKLWGLKTGKRLDTFIEPTKGQNTVAVSPDGRYVVAGGIDNRIRMWEITSDGREGTNRIRVSRFAHQAPLLNLVYSSDGRTLVSTSEDLSIKTWSAADVTQRRHFPGQSDWPAAVAVSTDTALLLVGRLDGTLSRIQIDADGDVARTPRPITAIPAPRGREVQAEAKLPTTSEREPNNKVVEATEFVVPGHATGVLAGDADLFQFASQKDESWVIETRARRDKSPADTRIEVLHADGRPVLRVLLRAVRDSAITFRPVDSRSNSARLDNWEEMGLNQYLYMAGEVVKNFRMPQGPDSAMQFYTIAGQRQCYFDTSATAHALNTDVYIVEPHRPGTRLPDNGLPVFPLYYANDDDGRRQIGSDSRLTFTAPTADRFLVRVTDVRGFGGKDFKYRLTVRPPRPRFEVSIGGRDATVPAGSGKRFTVNLKRIDGFSGEVRVDIKNLPPGFTATSPVVVQAGHLTAQGVINAAPDAKAADKAAWDKVHVTASASVLGKPVTQAVGNLGMIKLGNAPKVIVSLQVDGAQAPGTPGGALVIAPGQTITAMLKVTRNGYDGDLRFDVDNLPHGVIVDNIGLSGVLVRAKEVERQIFISAADWVPDTERLIHAVSKQEGGQASRPIRFIVQGGKPSPASR